MELCFAPVDGLGSVFLLLAAQPVIVVELGLVVIGVKNIHRQVSLKENNSWRKCLSTWDLFW